MSKHRKNKVNLREDKFEEQDPIYDDYPKEDDIMKEAEFISKLQSIEQFSFEEVVFVIDIKFEKTTLAWCNGSVII